MVLLLILEVGQVLKKPEAERSEEEASVLLLHRDAVEELCKRQVRRNVLKRKQEEVRATGQQQGNRSGRLYLDRATMVTQTRTNWCFLCDSDFSASKV